MMRIFEKFIQSYTHNGHIAISNPTDREELLSQQFVRNTDLSIDEVIHEVSDKMREKICITRFIRWDTEPVRYKPEISPPRSPAMAMRVVK
jgi:translation elongation factor EF-Ts